MELRWPWLAALLLVVPLLLWLWATLWRRPQDEADGVLVANVARLRGLPRYRAVVRRRFVEAAIRLGAVLLVILGAVLLAARPTEAGVEDPEAKPGDLLLCLEASPATYDDNIRILAQARALTGRLDGERIGLFVFSGATVTVLPLTDDYGYARQRLHETQQAFRNLQDDLGDVGAAKVGDGLVSCAQHFDRPEDERGRALVLGTAAEPSAGSLYTLGEAAVHSRQESVVVYGVTPRGRDQAALTDLRRVAGETGGRVFDAGDRSADRALVQLQRLERDRLDPPPLPVESDAPRNATILVLLGLVVLLVVGYRSEA